jgi:hypothetical protein
MSSKKKPKKDKNKERYSSIQRHRKVGKTLIPPLMTVPRLKPASWLDDRVPEMLWTLLLSSRLGREEALIVFRSIADWGHSHGDQVSQADISHTGLSEIDPTALENLLGHLCARRAIREGLRPLLLLGNLPARAAWEQALKSTPLPEDWEYLKVAVGSALDHQSESATDSRWARILFKIAGGKVHFQEKMKDLVEGILQYPHYGDLRAVRPTIRAMEGAFSQLTPVGGDWSMKFWAECLSATPCEPWDVPSKQTFPPFGTTLDRATSVYQGLCTHARQTRTTTGIDPRHDGAFGSALYAVALVQELLRPSVGTAILGRMGLRSLMESYLTLAFLAKFDSQDLWKKFRNFGAGQAKLLFLKLDESESKPYFVNTDLLEQMANEDMWQEMCEIGLGHWAGTDLRKMSEDVEAKPDYDNFNNWTSGYVHAQWHAVRDTVFTLCGNPLHRLHRIPRSEARDLNDVVADGVYLADKLIDIMDQLYPSFPLRLRVTWTQAG